MYGVSCPDCLVTFSRRDVMLRHRRHKHEATKKISHAYPQSSGAFPPPPPPPPPPPQGGLQSLTLLADLKTPPHPPPSLPEDVPPPEQQSDMEKSSSKSTMVLQHPFTMVVSGPTGECICSEFTKRKEEETSVYF